MFKFQAMKIRKRNLTKYCNTMPPKWGVTYMIKQRDFSLKAGTRWHVQMLYDV